MRLASQVGSPSLAGSGKDDLGTLQSFLMYLISALALVVFQSCVSFLIRDCILVTWRLIVCKSLLAVTDLARASRILGVRISPPLTIRLKRLVPSSKTTAAVFFHLIRESAGFEVG